MARTMHAGHRVRVQGKNQPGRNRSRAMMPRDTAKPSQPQNATKAKIAAPPQQPWFFPFLPQQKNQHHGHTQQNLRIVGHCGVQTPPHLDKQPGHNGQPKRRQGRIYRDRRNVLLYRSNGHPNSLLLPTGFFSRLAFLSRWSLANRGSFAPCSTAEENFFSQPFRPLKPGLKPVGQSPTHKQRKKKRRDVRIVIPEPGPKIKTRSQHRQNTGAQSRRKPPKGPGPERHNHCNQTGEHRRGPKAELTNRHSRPLGKHARHGGHHRVSRMPPPPRLRPANSRRRASP